MSCVSAYVSLTAIVNGNSSLQVVETAFEPSSGAMIEVISALTLSDFEPRFASAMMLCASGSSIEDWNLTLLLPIVCVSERSAKT